MIPVLFLCLPTLYCCVKVSSTITLTPHGLVCIPILLAIVLCISFTPGLSRNDKSNVYFHKFECMFTAYRPDMGKFLTVDLLWQMFFALFAAVEVDCRVQLICIGVLYVIYFGLTVYLKPFCSIGEHNMTLWLCAVNSITIFLYTSAVIDVEGLVIGFLIGDAVISLVCLLYRTPRRLKELYVWTKEFKKYVSEYKENRRATNVRTRDLRRGKQMQLSFDDDKDSSSALVQEMSSNFGSSNNNSQCFEPPQQQQQHVSNYLRQKAVTDESSISESLCYRRFLATIVTVTTG
eukprot:PhF_6_TR32385/c1_g1_i1/m.48039